MTTIRDRVQEIGAVMAKGDASPAEARRNEIMLAGLLSHINKVMVWAEVAYKQTLNECRSSSTSAAEAKMKAEATPAFADWVEAKATYDSAKQMLVTLRSVGRSISDEMKFTR